MRPPPGEPMKSLVAKWLLWTGALLVLGSTAMAQEPRTEPRLQLEVTPYLWLPSIDIRMNNQTRVGTTVTTDLSISPREYLTKMNFVGMVAAGARYERFSLLTDFIYLNANTESTRLRSVQTPVLSLPATDTRFSSTRIESTIWTLAGGYSVAEETWGQVDVIGGVRLLVLDQTVNYGLSRDVTAPGGSVVLNRGGNLSASGTFWNGIVGLRGRVRIPESNFYVPFHFDIGGGGKIWTWQAFTGIGYVTRWADIAAGYRYLMFRQYGDAIVEKMAMGGPILTATFRF